MNCDFQLEIQREGLPSVWMYGGGRQSVCIAGLISKGKLPAPDFAAIADTGREKQSTWDYLREIVQPVLPFEIHIVRKSEFGTVDLWGGKDGETLLIPAFTNQTGEIGKLDTFCSNEWKVRVVERWLRKRGVDLAQKWIGFSTDEPKRYVRMKMAHQHRVRFPLVEDCPMTAVEAVAYVRSLGWPEPHPSSCWMCPNMGDPEWTTLTKAEFEQACQLDEQIRLKDPNAFLHKSCVPLRQVKFQKSYEQAKPCESGVCFN